MVLLLYEYWQKILYNFRSVHGPTSLVQRTSGPPPGPLLGARRRGGRRRRGGSRRGGGSRREGGSWRRGSRMRREGSARRGLWPLRRLMSTMCTSRYQQTSPIPGTRCKQEGIHSGLTGKLTKCVQYGINDLYLYRAGFYVPDISGSSRTVQKNFQVVMYRTIAK